MVEQEIGGWSVLHELLQREDLHKEGIRVGEAYREFKRCDAAALPAASVEVDELNQCILGVGCCSEFLQSHSAAPAIPKLIN